MSQANEIQKAAIAGSEIKNGLNAVRQQGENHALAARPLGDAIGSGQVGQRLLGGLVFGDHGISSSRAR
jgi:hypothetical protein